MKQKQFTTRMRSEQLLKEVVEIWKQGNYKESLEGVEQDPIFALLITALSHRTGEIEEEIEMLKEAVINELSRRLIPHNQCRSIPGAAVVSTSIVGSVGELAIGSEASFTLSGSQHRFVPLFDTLIVNGGVESVTRIDGRRWGVRVSTKDPLSTLRGLSFYIDTKPFRDLVISLDNVEIPLVKPWDYANLPLSNIFGIESQFYNSEKIGSIANRWLDIFSQLNVSLFYLGYLDETELRLSEREYLDFVFEFRGIGDSFEFTQKQLKLNVVPVVNVNESWVDISKNNPIVRLQSRESNNVRHDFLNILAPAKGSNDYLKRVSVREAGTDRFTESTLYRLIRGILNRFSSDYYAFQRFSKFNDDSGFKQLHEGLKKLSDEMYDVDQSDNIGCYIALNRDSESVDGVEDSYRVRYLTTDAEQVNSKLNILSQFTPAKSIPLSISTVISEPLMGVASIQDELSRKELSKYNVITQDRLVTPADVKAFCIMELDVRYGVRRELINSIVVAPRLRVDDRVAEYVMEVEISIQQTLFVKRTLVNLEAVEQMLARLMSVRSVGVFSFDVKISV